MFNNNAVCRRKAENPPFQKIPDACRTTGLSQYYLRKGCKNGTVPHIRSGPTYYINVPELLRLLSSDAMSLT